MLDVIMGDYQNNRQWAKVFTNWFTQNSFSVTTTDGNAAHFKSIPFLFRVIALWDCTVKVPLYLHHYPLMYAALSTQNRTLNVLGCDCNHTYIYIYTYVCIYFYTYLLSGLSWKIST